MASNHRHPQVQRLASIMQAETNAFQPQTFNLVSYLTALENVQIPMYLAGVDEAEQEERAASLLDRIGLGDRLHHKPCELSVGQQQRVAIARALINDPVLVLADEPTGNLDSKSANEIMEILHNLHQSGRTIVMVTHEALEINVRRAMAVLDGLDVLTDKIVMVRVEKG